MKTKEYGEIVVLFPGEEIPSGLVLREGDDKSVVLEQHYGERDVDVLHLFELCNLHNKEDFVECIIIARQFEANPDIPIFILADKKVSLPEDVEEIKCSQESKARCLACAVKWNLRHPWDISPPREKCEQCLKHKATE